ncbi:hypothetical protein [Desulfurivibrio sp. C05AmB]|uniref:hypothetical protein n=1 Tax=Desulfurivibrio sp. C05AmB TaxID=3374371 RepID=UPI00376F3877
MRELYSTQLAIIVGILVLIASAAFAFLQAPELLEQPDSRAARAVQVVSHPIAGMEECSRCHGLRGTSPYPSNHTGWSDESCTRCHQPAS